MKPAKYCDKICRKGLALVNLIFRTFKCRKYGFLVMLFNMYVRPVLEYKTSAWSPYLLKDIDRVEQVQRTFSRRIPGLETFSYPDRLDILGLDTLDYRRVVS